MACKLVASASCGLRPSRSRQIPQPAPTVPLTRRRRVAAHPAPSVHSNCGAARLKFRGHTCQLGVSMCAEFDGRTVCIVRGRSSVRVHHGRSLCCCAQDQSAKPPDDPIRSDHSASDATPHHGSRDGADGLDNHITMVTETDNGHHRKTASPGASPPHITAPFDSTRSIRSRPKVTPNTRGTTREGGKGAGGGRGGKGDEVRCAELFSLRVHVAAICPSVCLFQSSLPIRSLCASPA